MFQIGFLSINSTLVLALRNLRTRWVRTILTTLGIVVGVAAMVSVNATNNSTLDSINQFFDEAAGESDLLVEAAVSGESFNEEAVQVVQRFPEVVAVAPVVVGVTIPAAEAEVWEEQYGAAGAVVPGTNFWLIGRDIEADAGIHEYALVNGRLLQPGESTYNLLLVDEYAAEKEIDVGDDFAIVTPDSGIVQLRVVGLIAKEGLGIANEGVIGIAPIPVVQELFNRAGRIDQIEVVVDDEISGDTAVLETLQTDIEARLGNGYDVKFPAARGALVANSLQSYQQGLNFFSVVSLFVGSFLIYNAFAMTVVERTREIGMLRAVGTTSRQILGMVFAEAALLGILGSVIGVLFGMLMARGLVVSMSAFTGRTIDQITASPQNIGTAMVVGVVVTLIAAAVPALQAARISPLQALRIQGSVDEDAWLATGLRFGPLTVFASMLILYYVPFRQQVAFFIGSNTIFVLLLGATLCIPILANPIERLVRPLIIGVFGNEGRLGSSNISRARGRTTLTVAALMVGISMVVGINGLTNSFELDIQDWIDTALGGDLFVRSPITMQIEVGSRLLALDEVTAVTPSRILATRLSTQSGADATAIFVGIEPESYLDVRGLRIEEGPPAAEVIAQLTLGGRVFVSADAATKYNIGIGDNIFLETRRGRLPFEVVASVVDFGGGDTTVITGSWNDMRQYFGVNDATNFAVKLVPDVPITAVTHKIENELGRGLNLSVESKSEFEQKIRNLSGQAFVLFDILSLIGLVVASLGVVNTMLMNVLERTREIGGLRSLGMNQTQVRRMILAEATTLGFIGGIFGVGFGAVLADVFIIGLRTIGGFVLTSRTPYGSMIISFFIAFIVAVGAAWYPAVRASRVNIISAIKHE